MDATYEPSKPVHYCSGEVEIWASRFMISMYSAKKRLDNEESKQDEAFLFTLSVTWPSGKAQ